MRVTGEDMQLYAVTDTQWLNGKDFLSVIESVLANGATFLQLREKNATHEEIVKKAMAIKPIAKKYGVPFVIDDDISYYLYNIENDILPDKNLQKLLSVYYDGKISEQELLNHIETKTVKPSKIYNMLNDLM